MKLQILKTIFKCNFRVAAEEAKRLEQVEADRLKEVERQRRLDAGEDEEEEGGK